MPRRRPFDRCNRCHVLGHFAVVSFHKPVRLIQKFYIEFENKQRLHWFCFTLLSDQSRKLASLSFSQSDAKLKSFTTWSPVFSRALRSLVIFTLSSHWLLDVFPFLLFDRCYYNGFGFTHSTEKYSMFYAWGSTVLSIFPCIQFLPGLILKFFKFVRQVFFSSSDLEL